MGRCETRNSGDSVMCISINLLFFFSAFIFANGQSDTTVFPAIITFGDSVVDVGNNNYLRTMFKADYPPYGRDFVKHGPTGRFCNGKLATDMTAESMGFTSFPPPYLNPKASGKALLIGANFASAGSGYDDKTSNKYHAISMPQQLKYYREYQSKLAKVAGSRKAASIIKDALYLVCFGSGDFVQNYYIDPLLNKTYTVDQYSDILVQNVRRFIKDLHGLGARKIGVTSLAPLGCLPAPITLFGSGSKGCVSRINSDAHNFNKKITSAANSLQKQLSGLKIVIFDIYTPLYELVRDPSKYGFVEAHKACCPSGTKGPAVLCKPKSAGICRNATQYVFWDGVHPSEAANQVIAESLVLQGISLVS